MSTINLSLSQLRGVLMPLRDSADFPDTGTFRERIYTAPKAEAKTDAETTASE
jgi:hypothetical protein